MRRWLACEALTAPNWSPSVRSPFLENTSVTESFPGTVADSHSHHRVDHKVIHTSTSMPHTALIKGLTTRDAQHPGRPAKSDRKHNAEEVRYNPLPTGSTS